MSGFNIRVYAIIINQRNEILLADEFVMNQYMTKFPGGGLHYGEGTLDCLKREIKEEMDQEIEVIGHFYTTDYYQPALFFQDTQLISIYYKAKLKNTNQYITSTIPIFLSASEGNIAFRWVPLNELSPDQLTFPIDQLVAGMILKPA